MSVEEARKHLASVGDEMADEEVQRLVEDLHALARLMLDIFQEKRRKEAERQSVIISVDDEKR